MSKFSVGEVCEGWVSADQQWVEVTLIRRQGYWEGSPMWVTDFTGGHGSRLFSESGLRKKRPPEDARDSELDIQYTDFFSETPFECYISRKMLTEASTEAEYAEIGRRLQRLWNADLDEVTP